MKKKITFEAIPPGALLFTALFAALGYGLFAILYSGLLLLAVCTVWVFLSKKSQVLIFRVESYDDLLEVMMNSFLCGGFLLIVTVGLWMEVGNLSSSPIFIHSYLSTSHQFSLVSNVYLIHWVIVALAEKLFRWLIVNAIK